MQDKQRLKDEEILGVNTPPLNTYIISSRSCKHCNTLLSKEYNDIHTTKHTYFSKSEYISYDEKTGEPTTIIMNDSRFRKSFESPEPPIPSPERHPEPPFNHYCYRGCRVCGVCGRVLEPTSEDKFVIDEWISHTSPEDRHLVLRDDFNALEEKLLFRCPNRCADKIEKYGYTDMSRDGEPNIEPVAMFYDGKELWGTLDFKSYQKNVTVLCDKTGRIIKTTDY